MFSKLPSFRFLPTILLTLPTLLLPFACGYLLDKLVYDVQQRKCGQDIEEAMDKDSASESASESESESEWGSVLVMVMVVPPPSPPPFSAQRKSDSLRCVCATVLWNFRFWFRFCRPFGALITLLSPVALCALFVVVYFYVFLFVIRQFTTKKLEADVCVCVCVCLLHNTLTRQAETEMSHICCRWQHCGSRRAAGQEAKRK